MNSSDLLNALSKLYTSGAWLCLAIVATFVVLDWLSKNVAWFEVPNRAHYLTAFLGGLALVVVPATQGTTPNVQTIAIAIGTVYALFTRGAVPVAKVARPAQSGFVTRGLVAFLAGFGLMIGCSWFRGTVEPDVADVIDCAKAEGTAQTIEDIVATFAAAVASGNVSAAVEGLVTKYGTQLVACSLAAIEKKPASGSAVAATTDPTSQAAAAVIASHGWKLK